MKIKYLVLSSSLLVLSAACQPREITNQEIVQEDLRSKITSQGSIVCPTSQRNMYVYKYQGMIYITGHYKGYDVHNGPEATDENLQLMCRGR